MWRCLVAKSRKTHLPPTETRIPILILSKQLAVTGVLTRRATPYLLDLTRWWRSLARASRARPRWYGRRSPRSPTSRSKILTCARRRWLTRAGFSRCTRTARCSTKRNMRRRFFSYLQTRVDEDRHRGRTPDAWVLTGSQHFGLVASITQALAARVGLLQLLPLALGELQAGQHSAAAAPLAELQWRGLYPPVVDRGVPPAVWYADHVVTGSEHAAPARQRARSVALSHLHAPARGALGENGQPDCIGRRLRQRPAAVAAVAIGRKSVNGWSKSAMNPWC